MKSILVVDDREENRYVVGRVLREAGYRVIEAGSGQEALRLATERPDLIVLDVRLPDILGYEVCKRIKSNPSTGDIPVLHISATFLSSESKVQALDSGADGYLTQPIEPPVLVATVRALLRLKEAEASSRNAARQWITTFDALPEGIALIDSENRIVRCNRAMAQWLNRDFGQVLGRKADDLLLAKLGINISRLTGSGKRQAQDVQKGKNWFVVTATPLRDDQGLPGHILIVSDVTEQKAAEEALILTEKLAATGRIANSIAHEINNPLEAMVNLLYLIKSDLAGPLTSKYVDLATQELDRISRITKQTLSFVRESNEMVEVSIKEVLQGLVILYAPQLSEKAITLVQQYESSSTIEGYPGRLRQVFSNLLFNAMEAAGQRGRIVIRIKDSCDWKNGNRRGVRITIGDDGCGIPPEAKGDIFEPFFTTKSLKGSGLGLWLSLGMISKHQGRIKLRSSIRGERHGTCFSVFLPFRQDDSSKQDTENAVA